MNRSINSETKLRIDPKENYNVRPLSNGIGIWQFIRSSFF